MKNYFGVIWFLPVLAMSCLLSRFISNVIGVGLFIISFIIFLLTKKLCRNRKISIKASFILMVFCSLHFFGYCILELDSTEYESFSKGKTAEAVSWVLYLPLAFVFSLTAGLLFDKWLKIKNICIVS